MDKNIIRSSKIVKIIGIIDTIIFSLIALFLILAGNFLASVFFIPFVVLGIVLILAHEKQIIVIEKDELCFHYLIKKEQHIKFTDIRCLLLIPLKNRAQTALIGKKYERLITLDAMLTNLDLIFDTLEQKGIEALDFGEMVENNKNVSKYVPILNAIERRFYKSIVNERKTLKNMSKGKMGFNITKTEKVLRIAGWILLISNLAAFLIGGKEMPLILIAILLVSYAIYIKYYPYMYIDAFSKKGPEIAFQMPFTGASTALILCVAFLNLYNYDFGDYMKITVCITIILAIPFMIKSSRTTVPQKLSRKISVVFAAFTIAFAITFPINFLLTLDEPTHETTIITDKYVSTSSKTRNYYLCGNWNGEEEEFSVSKSEYNSTSIGDMRRICIKQSVFGLEYYTLHQ